ncbi:MAG: GIY-YIG nuclease family protein [Salinivirgaceae bacterium]|nr:GIY-YIG nuclease family protein [Salinivirgaceae bacterium]
MERFYYVYLLKSLKDGKHYTAYTKNLKIRFNEHANGKVASTKSRRPLVLIYFEGCLNQQDATYREKYLKTHYGKMYLKNRLKHWNDEE